MAKANRGVAADTGLAPFCTGMLLCETSLLEKGGGLSIIRVMDTVSTRADNPPLEEAIVELVPLKMIAFLRTAGGKPGECEIEVGCVTPTGKKMPVGSAKAVFRKGQGCEIVTNLRIRWGGQGEYWLEVLYDGKVLGRTLLNMKLVGRSEKRKGQEHAPH